MKTVVLLSLSFIFSTLCTGQNLRVEQTIFNTRYFEDPKEITKEAFEIKIKSDPVSAIHYKRFESYNTAYLISSAGVGAALVGGIVSEDPTSKLIWYSSAGVLSLIDLLFILGRKSALDQSIEAFNQNNGLGKVKMGVGRIVIQF